MNLKNVITAAALRKPVQSNMNSVIMALDKHGAQFGLNQPHRLAQFLPQVMHESGDFKYDKEIWGPTEAQKRYEGRKDLGNTQKGDGKKFMGHGPIQVTGRANTKEFYEWCKARIGGAVPDFVADPDKINTDPWEGLSAIWYWSTRNLNRYADEGDIEMITKRINGGLNGYNDRLARYDRVALVMLGYGPTDIKRFQADHKLKVDGVSGPRTRSAMHTALTRLTPTADLNRDVKPAPVFLVETKTETVEVEKPVVPDSVETEVKAKTDRWSWITGLIGGGGIGIGGLAGMDWQAVLAAGAVVVVVILILFLLRRQIVAAVRGIQQRVEG